MIDEEFVALRIDGATPQILSQPAAVDDLFRTLTVSQVSVTNHTLGVAELPDLIADTGVVGVARNMPMTLIHPLADDGPPPVSSAGDATWGVEAVGALKSERTGAGAIVAVLDTGINKDHQAFKEVPVIVQKDFTGEGDGDDNGHGTHCAGTVCGGLVEGKRIGVAPGVDKLLVGKVLGAAGGGSTKGIVNAMLWAAQQGANVISMSLGLDFPGMLARHLENGLIPEVATSRTLEVYRENLRLYDTLAALIGKGGLFARSVVVAASGNESNRPEYELAKAPPSAADGIMSVGALGKVEGELLEVASFSNTGPAITAPGVGVESASHASNDGLKSLKGTSMATPHVAGVAALWFEELTADNPQFEMSELEANLTGRACKKRFAESVNATSRGAGLVQAP